MKTLLKSLLLTLCCFAGVAAHASGTPDTQWTYKTINGKALKMDVFLPEGYSSDEKSFPAIVFYHGGSWRGGLVSWHYPDCAYWSKRGMIAVSVDYRLKDRDQVEVPLECVKDAKSAVRFLRKNAKELQVDVDKIVVAGGSAGGQMAAAVATIDNVNDQSDDLAISCTPNAAVMYNPYFKCEEELRPPNFIVKGLPPMISFLGSEDPSVSVESLKAFHEDLKKAGNVSEFYVGKGGKHGFCIGTKVQNPFFYWSLELVDAFLVKHGILTGENQVVRPEGVEPLQPEEFETYLYAEGIAQEKQPVVSSSKPNIVFIYADDWGWGDLSCHGHEWLKTPNIDRLASEGTDFMQFNVLHPVCSPSRTALMTGMCPARFSIHAHFMGTRANSNRHMPDWLDPKATMLPRLLKQAGYRTGHFGKWHLTNGGVVGAPKPYAYGYDTFAVFNGGEGWSAAGLHETAANTVAFIEENKDQPFFVNVWLHESHVAHVPTPESMEKWKHLDEQKQVYSAVITDGDNAVGLILEALKREGLADNTIVMFSSDNGPEWTHFDEQHKKKGEGYGTWASIGQTGGLRGKKRSLYEGGVRLPFIVRWPGHTPAGATNNTTVLTTVDMLPTLCAAAAVKLPADYQGDGENMLPALQGNAITRTRPIFWEWRGTKPEPDWWPYFAVRDGDWKLLMTENAERVELHNMKTDRAEETGKDLSKTYPEIVARLTKMIYDWKATLPTKADPSCFSPTRSAN